jgi:hypothetical protein
LNRVIFSRCAAAASSRVALSSHSLNVFGLFVIVLSLFGLKLSDALLIILDALLVLAMNTAHVWIFVWVELIFFAQFLLESLDHQVLGIT